MAQGLDDLAKTLKKEDFLLLKYHFTQTSPEVDWTLVTEKEFIPYSCLDSFGKFREPLPPFGNCWKNSLTGKVDITEAQYEQALHIYNILNANILAAIMTSI